MILGWLTSLSTLSCVFNMPQLSHAALGNFSSTERTRPLLRLMGVLCLCRRESRPLQIFLVDLVQTELRFIIAVFWAVRCLISVTLMMFSSLLCWTRGCGENVRCNFPYHWIKFCLLCPSSFPALKRCYR